MPAAAEPPGRAVVVGGGVLGTIHALWAVRRGWQVVHLEADLAPRRASVRNFGLIWVSGRAPGVELDLALRARQLWEETAWWAGYDGLRCCTSLTVATTEAELEVLSQVAGRADAERREFELLDEPGTRALEPSLRGALVGALHCRLDAVVEPSTVLAGLRRALEATDRYAWVPGRTAIEVRSGEVVDHEGQRIGSDLVVVCPGDRFTGISGPVGDALASAPLRRCRLQMMQTAPADQRVSVAVADADSLRYYPAFEVPGRHYLPAPEPEVERWRMQLLLVQRAGGELTIGDTHVYDEPFDFAVEEAAYERLSSRAEALLGWHLPPVRRRWAGEYALAEDGAPAWRAWPEPGVVVVTGPAGRGMTLAPAIAEQTWQEVAP